jgi:hypothetical protein
MDASQTRERRERWQAVAEVEADERQRSTVENRWRQLNAILHMAHELGLNLREQSEDDQTVWERWAQVKEGLP